MASHRYRTLDFLRGLMLVVMTIDHLDLYGPVYRFTYETTGFVSAAEGFVLLSGIVAGLVYGRHVADGRLASKVRGRLQTLWRHHLVVVSALFLWWCWLPGERPASSLLGAVGAAVGGGVLLNQEPPLDILAMYVMLVALLWPTLRAFTAGRTWWLMGAVAALWLVDQVLSAQVWYPFTLEAHVAQVPVIWHPNHFHLLAWPLLFTLGVWGGWRRRQNPRAWSRAAGWPLLLPALIAVGILACLRHGVVLPQYPLDRLEVGRGNLGWLRLLNVALVVWLILQVGLRRPGIWRCRWLELLGRHALPVFVWHAVLQLYLRPFYLEAAQRWGWSARILILTLAVASLTLPAWWRQRRSAM